MDEHRIHQVFQFSVALKGAHAVLECLGGIALALISTEAIATFINTFTQDESTEDPHDFISSHLRAFAQDFSVDTKNFYVFYLLSHGLVKLALVVGLLKEKLWAYPASLGVLGLFIAYQLYRYSYTQGFGLIVLTVFDLVVMWLVWHEYSLVRRHLPVK